MSYQPRSYRPNNLLHPTSVPTNFPSMSYNAKTRTFAIEDSMLCHSKIIPSRVWNDACDVGYTLVSHRTGKEVAMAMDDVLRDADGDIQAWVYKSVWPKGMDIKLTVYND